MMAIDHGFPVPERLWFVNTDMKSFKELPRQPGDDSAFAHWLAAGRLFVTPTVRNPRKYHDALVKMMPGDPVFAYESQVGFVALGWVRGPKDLQDSHGGTALYPKPHEIVRSLAVNWDTSVTRTMSEVSAHTLVGQHGLQISNAGTPLHNFMVAMLQEAYGRRRADAAAQEADTLKRIKADPKYDNVTKVQLVRLGRPGAVPRWRACPGAGVPGDRHQAVAPPRGQSHQALGGMR